MAEYAMSLKTGNGLVFKTKSNSLEEAVGYFAKLNQMSKIEINKLFIVTEIKSKKQ